MENRYILGVLILAFFISGCTPLVVGGTAAGGYKTATDERTVGRMWDDSTITGKVKTQLTKDNHVKARNIDVDTVEGVVYLTGVVDSWAEANRAVKIARGVKGVKRVESGLQVGTRSAGQIVDDQVIARKINGKLIKEPGIRSLNIDVDVYNGIVNLIGIVKTDQQKNRVEQLVREVAGVVKILNRLKVKK
jgi:hyperosmotically inducible protein